ncbi:MAG: protein phosphatase 2C domain-containing protein [Myxococcales bacterium]|nr:protein phosphatase 2C domain-containing protein [Myxococcales bacterium]
MLATSIAKPVARPSAAPAPQCFAASAASLIGRAHSRVDRNNQDGWAIARSDDYLIAIVTDGCSSGALSEIGARIGARWLARQAAQLLDHGTPLSSLAAVLDSRLTRFLGELALLCGGRDGFVETVGSQLLFSITAAVITRDRWVALCAGDGVVLADGVATIVDAGPGEAPPYPAYRLLRARDLSAPPLRSCALRVICGGSTATLQTLAVGSDGCRPLLDSSNAAPLVALGGDAALTRNPSLLQKRLRVVAREVPLADDTTCVLLQRRGAAAIGNVEVAS